MAFSSGQAPKSKVLSSTFVDRLNSIFGFRTGSNGETQIEKKYGIKFVRVDLNNDAYRVRNASIGSVYSSKKFSTTLEKYFDSYLSETTLAYNDIQERQVRLNELSYMYYNDPYISRVCKLCADEATQIDSQDRLIVVKSPNVVFVQKVYELLSQWGVTQQRIHGVCFDLELYGESFWAQKISMRRGVERIIPIFPTDIMERLEFNPEKMAKYLSEKNGYLDANKDRGAKIKRLADLLSSEESFDDAENFADLFDTKLLGYELHDNNVVPPWVVTHFRFDADHSEFYPYGRPPLLACLAPFKQTASAMALDGLARSMSFPLTLYKVKVTEGTAPGRAFELVSEVHEEFDNIGVSPMSAGSEVYTVNTKIWVPDGLLDVDVKESKVDLGSIDAIKEYSNRVATASGVPRSYLDPGNESFEMSGVALVQQYKPFARHVYEIQSSFLQGLGELIRLHFAITGEFDYNTPFTLSMRFPAAELSADNMSQKTSTVDLCEKIAELLKTSLGLEDDEPLPLPVIEDILAKYSFLDPTDLLKWFNTINMETANSSSDDDDDSDGGDGGDDMDFGGDDMDLGGGDDSGGDDGGDLDLDLESTNLEKSRNKYLKRMREERYKTVKTRYKESKDSIYFKFLESEGFTEWTDKVTNKVNVLVPKITENSKMYGAFKMLNEERTSMQKLND